MLDGSRREQLHVAVGVVVLAGCLWFALGMNRGLLLSSGIKAKVWPWAPYMADRQVVAPALSDPVWQFVPWLQLARRELRAGRLPLWNPYQDAGVPLLANLICGVASPLATPVLVAGVARAWNLSLLLRVLVAALGAFLWLRSAGRAPPSAAMGALMFALSGPFIAWLEHPQTLVMAWVPWLLLAVERLASNPSPYSFAGTAVASLLVLTGGHPEVALMAGLLAGAVAVRASHDLRGLVRCVGAGLLGLGLSAPVLLPFAEYLHLGTALSGKGRHAFVLPLAALVRFIRPHSAVGHPIEAAVTVSFAGLLLAVAAVVLCRRRAGVIFWSGVAVAILLLTYDNPLARQVAVHTPIYATRTLLLLPLALAFLAAAAFDEVRARISSQRARTVVTAALPLLVLGELLAAAHGVHAVSPPADVQATTPMIRFLQADHGVFRILPLHTFLPPNSATVFGLEDVRGYDAIEPAGWLREREAIGRSTTLPTVTDVIEPWSLVRGGKALSFWNVKYLLLHPQFRFDAAQWGRSMGLDLALAYEGPDGRVFLNRDVLPRVRCEGGGRARLEYRDPQNWRMTVRSPSPDVLVVANPFFPGWRASIDGTRVPLAMAAGEAIRIPIPSGVHRVELKYRPLSFDVGLGAAGLSVLLCILWMVASRRSGRSLQQPAHRREG